MEEHKSQNSVGFQFGMFMRVFRKLVVKRFQEHDTGLTMEQFAILHRISEEDEPTQSEIAAAIGLDKSAVMRIIDILEDKRLVARLSDGEDRRKKALVITKKGGDKIEEAGQFFETIIEELSEGVNADDMQSFLKTLNKLRHNAEKH